MGWGVEQGETFEAVVEAQVSRRLAELAAGGFELMNLSVPGYRPPQQVMALEEALKFSPHIVFYTAAGREQWNTISFLADILAEGVEIPYPELKQIVARSEEHTSELQSLMRISYAVFCLKKKTLQDRH